MLLRARAASNTCYAQFSSNYGLGGRRTAISKQDSPPNLGATKIRAAEEPSQELPKRGNSATKRLTMKYIAPEVLTVQNASSLIQGGKHGMTPDSENQALPSPSSGYDCDE